MSTTDTIEIWEPSDSWIAGLIRHLRGLTHDEAVPAGLIASWRRCLRQEVVRVGRDRAAGRDPYPAPGAASISRITTGEVIREMLDGPEGRFWIGVMLSMPRLIEAVARPTAEQVVAVWSDQFDAKLADRAQARELRAYLDSKLDGGARRYRRPEPGVPHLELIAAVNACTEPRVRAWRSRLADRAAAAAVLAEMVAVGVDAIHGLPDVPLTSCEPGLPRGLWPDPPPPPLPELETVVGASVAAGAAPTFIPGRSA